MTKTIFNTAEEARRYVENYRHDNVSLSYTRDTNRMLYNVSKLITELSRLEVEARQTRKQHKVIECRVRLNEAIDHLEKIFIIAKLMQ